MPALVLKSRWRECQETFSDEDIRILNLNVVGDQLKPPGLFLRVCVETRPLLERMGISLPSENDDLTQHGDDAASD
jgi:hypothetical protein